MRELNSRGGLPNSSGEWVSATAFGLDGETDPPLENRDVAEKLGAAGRAVALAEFTEDRMVDRFLEVYRKLGP
jgi:glycosyltransferase involved in cell wall biosynthesis